MDNKTVLNVGGEIFDVTYNEEGKAVGKSRKTQKEFTASCVYRLIVVIQELNI